MTEKEIKSRVITLGELWDILNEHDVPFNSAAQNAMIEASECPKPTVVDKLRGIFHGCKNL